MAKATMPTAMIRMLMSGATTSIAITRGDEPLHRVDAHHPHRVDLLAGGAGAEVGGDRSRARAATEQQAGGHGRTCLMTPMPPAAPIIELAPSWWTRLPTCVETITPNGIAMRMPGIAVTVMMNQACESISAAGTATKTMSVTAYRSADAPRRVVRPKVSIDAPMRPGRRSASVRALARAAMAAAGRRVSACWSLSPPCGRVAVVNWAAERSALWPTAQYHL